MGVDWCRARLKPGVQEADLRALVDLQAGLFQAAFLDEHGEDSQSEAERQLIVNTYIECRNELEAFFDRPPLDEVRLVAEDDPEFLTGWRVYAIAYNSTLPVSWRREAYRTFLPSEVPAQVARWRQWIKQVESGLHRTYLMELYRHEATTSLAAHFTQLKNYAKASLPRKTNWAQRPAFLSARDSIFAYCPLPVHPAPGDPPDAPTAEPVNLETNAAYQSVRQAVETQCRLTRDWSRSVKGNFKLSHSGANYPTFASFLGWAQDDWLAEFLDWAEECGRCEMALVLDS